MQKKNLLRAAALAVTLAAAPLAYSPAEGVSLNSACAQKMGGTGTCCFQTDAICITPTGNIAHAYYQSEGPCP